MSEAASPPPPAPPAPPRRLLVAAVVLSACLGLVAGAGSAWAIYQRLGPAVERVAAPAPAAAGDGSGAAPTYASIAQAAQPSLVRVATRPLSPADLAAGAAGLATGFLATSDGLVVTSAHAVEGATRLQVAFSGGQLVDATVAGSDPARGIAVLRAATVPVDQRLVPLGFADFSTAPARPGDLVLAVGAASPGGLTVTAGTVSAVGRSLRPQTGSTATTASCSALLGMISVNASAEPQADGAPLLDAEGKVVGVVTTAALAQAGGIVAADGRRAAALVADLARGRAGPRPSFGVETTPIDAAAAAAVRTRGGELVLCVTAAGPAEAAGLLPGDVVTAVDSTALDADHPLDATALGLSTGQRVVLTVVRGGEERQVPVVVG